MWPAFLTCPCLPYLNMRCRFEYPDKTRLSCLTNASLHTNGNLVSVSNSVLNVARFSHLSMFTVSKHAEKLQFSVGQKLLLPPVPQVEFDAQSFIIEGSKSKNK